MKTLLRSMRWIPAAAMLACVYSTDAQPTEPRDSLEGPPFVSCKAWALADGRTGEIIEGFNSDKGLKVASTTKIMCAYVILQLAKENRGVLREKVTFSKTADETVGSTSAIREGESLTVGKCLYALMLPSGNDAGNALAEHFNERLEPPGSNDAPLDKMYRNAPTAPRRNFIAEMNRVARRLGMTNTVYRTPFGDGGGDDAHTTSARDLIRLAALAMKGPLFRKVVGTRRYECEVTDGNGGRRTLVWENTNELLKIEGYDGVKTGTNTGAGACLVASVRRGGRHLLCVVLHSSSRSGRYVDARNLLRWGLVQRGR
jgi:D-alanyl-D-alanine carboxypeptidase (penicillin-binding protein 5/6)